MASINRRDSGWAVRIPYYSSEGKRKFVNKQGFRTQAEARAFAIKTEADLQDGVNLESKSQPFIDYYINWYKTFKEPVIAAATKRRYRATISVLQYYFPKQTLGEITRMDYQTMLNKYANGDPDGDAKHQKGHAKASVQKLNIQTRECVQDAIQDGALKHDFTYKANIGGSKGRDERSKYLDETEMWKLLRYESANPNALNVTKAMIVTALYTGMRIAEVGALTIDDINWNFKTITINKSWDFQKYGFKSTKTDSSNRIIRVNDELLEYLHAFLESQKLYEYKNPDQLVFITTRGWVPDSTATTAELKNACEYLNITRITFHGLRHTHASYLLSTGSSIEYVSKRLGHASIETTLRVYAHLLKDRKTAEDSKALDAFSPVQHHNDKKVHR